MNKHNKFWISFHRIVKLFVVPILLAAATIFISPNSASAQVAACPDMKLEPVLPYDAKITSQAAFNCFAWQQFIAVNWAAESGKPGKADISRYSASNFGTLPPTEPTVWESYSEADSLFRSDGKTPDKWGKNNGPEVSFCRQPFSTKGSNNTSNNNSDHGSTFSVDLSVPKNNLEAGGGDHAYLIGQNKKLVYYDVRVNREFHNYVVENKFYTVDAQLEAFAKDGKGINVPTASSSDAKEGTLVIKAAWLEIDDVKNWPRHRTIKALLYPPRKIFKCRVASFALVGLHIARKTRTATQWVWSTFEHIDNAPDKDEVNSGNLKPAYTFYNPACSKKKCPWNKKPKNQIDDPVQVVRLTPIRDHAGSGNNVATLNAQMQEMFRKNNPNSVWQYYQLVNVLWPESPVPVSKIVGKSAPTAPFPDGGATPNVMVNTTLETYSQYLNCLSCHRHASTVWGGNYGSDYTFLFRKACGGSSTRGSAICYGKIE